MLSRDNWDLFNLGQFDPINEMSPLTMIWLTMIPLTMIWLTVIWLTVIPLTMIRLTMIPLSGTHCITKQIKSVLRPLGKSDSSACHAFKVTFIDDSFKVKICIFLMILFKSKYAAFSQWDWPSLHYFFYSVFFRK